MFARINSIASAIRRRLSFVLRGNATAFPATSSSNSANSHLPISHSANCGEATDYEPFATLSRQEQAVVTRYLIAVSEMLGLLDCIQHRGRAVDHPAVLRNFATSEADFVRAGFMPFIPGALKASQLSSLEPQSIDRSRLVRRRVTDNHVCFAQAMRLQVERLLRSGKVIQLDSKAAEERLRELCAASRADQNDHND